MADYNINAVTRRVVYTGSAGVGPYAFSFEVLSGSDVAVYKNATKLSLSTHYTVTVNSNGTGSVTLTTAATGSDTITIIGARAIERTTDFVTAGDLLASSINDQLDSQIIMLQQLAEADRRSLRAPPYDPAATEEGGSLNMTLPAKADRVGRLLAFNSTTGNPEAGPTVVDFSSVAPNTAAAAASASAAATSASSASSSASGASTSASAASSSASAAATSASAASTSASAASTSATDAAASATLSSQWAYKTSGTVSGGEYSAKYYALQAAASASTASTASTDATASATLANDWATKTTGAVAGGEYSAKYHAQAAASSATSAASAQSAAEAARDQTLAAFDSFDDRYLGTKTSDPSVDNDGNALVAGALYFNSTSGVMKVYTGTAWVPAYVSGSGSGSTEGALLAANNLSDLGSVTSARTNLGLGTAATSAASDFAAASHTHTAAAISDSTTAGRALLTGADAAAQRTSLGLGSAATSATSDFAAASHTHTASAISDSTAAGRALLTGADAAAQRTSLGLGTAATMTGPSGTMVGTTDTQTLTNKTLTTPVINGMTGDTSLINIGSGQIYKATGGNVGIGTTSPGSKLTVAGTIESTTGGIKFPDGTTQTTSAASSNIDTQTFNSSGTWTKPTGYASTSRVLVQAWGAGGSGGKASSSWNAGGGGGGGYIERWLNLSQLGATETITIGAGGATRTTTGVGTAGGNTTVGSLVTAYGGGPGMGSGTGNGGPGSGGGMTSAGTAGGVVATNLPGKPYIMVGTDATNGAYYQGGSGWLNPTATPDSIYHGGSGGAGSTSGCGGGNSVYGGGGGGGSALNVNAAGTSLFGGNGGAGGGTPAAGTQPGGGGGAGTNAATSTGAGAAGRVIITVFPA